MSWGSDCLTSEVDMEDCGIRDVKDEGDSNLEDEDDIIQ